eukprot:scaffold1652_cov101-Skeletonema_marinoi.AAC.1
MSHLFFSFSLDYACVSQGISTCLKLRPIPRQLFHTTGKYKRRRQRAPLPLCRGMFVFDRAMQIAGKEGARARSRRLSMLLWILNLAAKYLLK